MDHNLGLVFVALVSVSANINIIAPKKIGDLEARRRHRNT